MYLQIKVINKDLKRFKELREVLNMHGFFINAEYSDKFIDDCISDYIACPICKEVTLYDYNKKSCNNCGYKEH